ncbi:MAG: FAD-dependent oxidoreductase [Anaeromyxobacter sp.]
MADNVMQGRRHFLRQGAAVLGGTVASATLLTGCDDSSSSAGWEEPKWAAAADVVIIGFGGAAATAAVHAAKAGASVLIVETTKAGGGASAVNGGGQQFGGGTATQLAAGYSETTDQYFEFLKLTAGEGADESILRAFADNAKATYDWLVSIGAAYEVESLVPGDSEDQAVYDAIYGQGSHPLHQHNVTGGAATLWPLLDGAARAAGAQLVFETSASRLIVNDAGRVVGVAARPAGSDAEVFYKANRAVCVAAGGFINNAEMVARWLPFTKGSFQGGSGHDLGQGIQMAQAVGADVAGMNHAEEYATSVHFGGGRYLGLAKAIAVTPAGDRLYSEDASAVEVGAWLLHVYPTLFYVMDDALFTSLPGSMQGSPAVVSDETLEGLAAKLGIPTGKLTATVTRYNANIETDGTDPDFHKPGSLLQPIAAGPFHALVASKAAVFTLSTGGLRINASAQVLKPSGEAIPGLYAVGASSAHIAATHYPAGAGTAGGMVLAQIAGPKMAAEPAWK